VVVDQPFHAGRFDDVDAVTENGHGGIIRAAPASATQTQAQLQSDRPPFLRAHKLGRRKVWW